MPTPTTDPVIKLAINGYGRIRRCVLRAWYESAAYQHLRIVAINEPADLTAMAHLTQYDGYAKPIAILISPLKRHH